jgi:hypothetical protein
MVAMRKGLLGGSLLLLVVVAIAACGGGAGNHDYSSAIVRSIQANGTRHIQRATNGLGRSGKATIDRARCVQMAGTERYSCIVHYSYQNSEGTYQYEVNVSAICDGGGKCQWHLDGDGTLIRAEPD